MGALYQLPLVEPASLASALRDLRLAGVRGVAAQALRLLRLDGLFELFPDVNAARLAFRPKA